MASIRRGWKAKGDEPARIQHTYRQIGWFGLALAAGGLVWALPAPEGLRAVGHRYLALLTSLVVMFVTEPVPLPLIMAAGGCGLALLGIGTPERIWTAYAHPVVFFVLGCLMMANVAERVGLTRRLGRLLVRHCGTNVVKFSFASCMVLGTAAAFMHDVSALTIGLMAVLPLLRRAGISPGSPTGIFVVLAMAFSSSAGGMGTLVGGGRNMVAAGLLRDLTGERISFFQWAVYAMPAALVAIPAVWGALYLVFRPDPTLHFSPTDAEGKTGGLTADEKRTLAVIALIFLGFFTRGWHGQDYSVLVVAGAVLLTALGLVEWDFLNERTEWAVSFLVFGGGISLGQAMHYTGVAEYLAGAFLPLFEGRGWFALFLGVGILASLLTQLMANVATAALIMPIAVPVATMAGINPVIVTMALGMFTSFAYLLVVGCPPNVVAYSAGYFRTRDLMRGGIVAQPAGILVTAAAAYLWWSLIGLV